MYLWKTLQRYLTGRVCSRLTELSRKTACLLSRDQYRVKQPCK